MKPGWTAKKLGDLYDIGSAKRVHKKDWKSEGVPFYRAREIVKLARNGSVDNELFISEEQFAEYKALKGAPATGDLMVTGVGTLGICYLVKEHDRFYFKDASVLWFRPKREVEARFIEYAFQTPQLISQSNDGSGATVGTLTIGRAQDLALAFPPLEEQRRIVAVLDKAFEGLDRARKNTEANLASAKELFESTLKSRLDDPPPDWKTERLDSICSKIGSGATPKGGAKSYKSEGTSLIRGLNVHDRLFKFEKLAFIDEQQADLLKNVVVERSDVLFNITGASVARCSIVPDKVLPARVNQHVAILRPNPYILDPHFLCLLLTSEGMKNALLKQGAEGGATRQAITKSQLQQLKVRFPDSVCEQKKIVVQMQALEQNCLRVASNNTHKRNAIANLRQSLLQRAFAGELT